MMMIIVMIILMILVEMFCYDSNDVYDIDNDHKVHTNEINDNGIDK